jgi:hypothetical protein
MPPSIQVHKVHKMLSGRRVTSVYLPLVSSKAVFDSTVHHVSSTRGFGRSNRDLRLHHLRVSQTLYISRVQHVQCTTCSQKHTTRLENIRLTSCEWRNIRLCNSRPPRRGPQRQDPRPRSWARQCRSRECAHGGRLEQELRQRNGLEYRHRAYGEGG